MKEKIEFLEKEIEVAKRNADKLTIELDNQVNTSFSLTYNLALYTENIVF